MSRPPRLAVLASGHGGNLQAIMEACTSGELNAMVALVVSDRATAFAIERASKAGIPTRTVLKENFPVKEKFDAEMSKFISEFRIDWIILAGFMRILSRSFVKKYKGKILNIHPALLPKYPGMHAIEKAYLAQDHDMGVTVHFVDEGVDTGPIIVQESFYRQPSWTLQETQDIIHSIEHRLYPRAIASVIRGDIKFPNVAR